MNTFCRITISKFYNVVSASLSSLYSQYFSTETASVRNITYLSYQKTKNNCRYGETLKDAVENETEEEKAAEQLALR